jgi:uncharacterized membrane protein YoaK (UPF0700 family)
MTIQIDSVFVIISAFCIGAFCGALLVGAIALDNK